MLGIQQPSPAHDVEYLQGDLKSYDLWQVGEGDGERIDDMNKLTYFPAVRVILRNQLHGRGGGEVFSN